MNGNVETMNANDNNGNKRVRRRRPNNKQPPSNVSSKVSNSTRDDKPQVKKSPATGKNNGNSGQNQAKARNNNNAPGITNGSHPNQKSTPLPGANSNNGDKRKQPPSKANQQQQATKNDKQKRENRKMGRRAKQLESMERKAKVEDEFYRRCQREAAAKRQQQPTEEQNKAREVTLFGKQGAQGINFAKYDAITVDVKPGIFALNGKNKKKTTTTTTKNNNHNNEALSGDEVTSIVFSNFDELDLPLTMRHNIKLMNYAKSTPIQRHAIPLGMAGHDLMCCAQTGSGKTCAFLLPVCASLAAANTTGKNNEVTNGPVEPKCIVLAPTRELASQIELEAEKLCFADPHLRPVAVYGGASQQKQIRELAFAATSNHSVIVVATPGRLTDFVDRELISLRDVQYLILDEADRMLDMGFEPQIRRLVLRSGMTPKADRQTAMFSATFPDKIQLLASEFLRESYTWIAVGRVGSTTDSITQVLKEATADKRQKLKLVVEAVQDGPAGRTLVFVQKKKTATWLKKQLSKGGPEGWEFRFAPIDAVEIHGDRSQSQREAALAQFRSGECRILVATDVAARGLDIDGVEHVINMDLPTAADDFDSYVHRIGRTGRAGHTGLATSLYVPGDAPKVGNRKIALKLIQQLRESKQIVPAFLEAECSNNGGCSIRGSSAGQQFGGSDVRKNGGGRGRGGDRKMKQ